MAFTIPISSLVNQYLALVDKDKSWKDIKFWSTHDHRHLSLNELTKEHIINICRQIVNEACVQTGLDPIPVPNPLARINFGQAPVYEWVLFCKALLGELQYRADSITGPLISHTYANIWQQVREKVAQLSMNLLKEKEEWHSQRLSQ